MNVFDFALKMEFDGEKYYREQASKVKDGDLKVVLEGLAADEQRHYTIVKALQNKNFNDYIEADPSIKEVRNVFERVKGKELLQKDKDSIAKLKDEQLDVYRAALIVEEESVQLYKKLQETSENQGEKDVLYKLMHEEENHAEVLGNIIQMLNHVSEWVESAEFHHQKPY